MENDKLSSSEDEEIKKEATAQGGGEEAPSVTAQSTMEELNDRYLRLYAEFDNYRKRVTREKEELSRFGNESLLSELLPAIDNLELALKHSPGNENSGLLQGVQMTLKELQRTLEKFGLKKIEAVGKEFDPAIHHAMTRVERQDMEEKMVAEEFRTGYRYHEKVLRPSLVAVSVRPQPSAGAQGT